MSALFKSKDRWSSNMKKEMKLEVTASGSGVIIAKRYVLTAAHVVENTKESYIVVNKKKIKLNGLVIPNRFC